MNAGTLAILIGVFSTLIPFIVFYYVFRPKGKKWYIWILYVFVSLCTSGLLKAILIDVMVR